MNLTDNIEHSGIRKIQLHDDPQIAAVIRAVMTEFKGDPRTTILGDPTLDKMYSTFQATRAVYYVAEEEGAIIGGCGIRQLDGTTENICELQRMFLLPKARGKGYGKALMTRCLTKAREYGYDRIYLESLGHMHDALKLYEKTGFKRISTPLGDTGHGGCNVFMMMDLGFGI